MTAKLLIVDDEPLNINVLVELFKPHYKLAVAKNGEQALQRAADDPPPDLVLLDVMMPGMDGYEVLRRLRETLPDLPVIFVTAMGEQRDEQKGLELGAVDYVTKPISPPIVAARVKNHLELQRARQFLKDQNALLEGLVQERTRELLLTQDVTIQALASLAETRDNETGAHIRRTQLYVQLLAQRLRSHPRYGQLLDDRLIDLMSKSAPLHDIGKVGVPDAVLLKPGRLTDEEFTIMKRHPTLGRDALQRAEDSLEGSSSFLRVAREIAYSHHEKWDGTGYPEGLSGEAIPLGGRIMALADVYDALISKRCYKEAFSHEEAVRIIGEGRGQHFDPELVDVFLECAEEIRAVAESFKDH